MSERRFESGRTFGYRESKGNVEVSYEAGVRLWNAEGEMIASVGERGDVEFWMYLLYSVMAALQEARAAKTKKWPV